MICIIALIVFGIMGIFSATHRKLALEAFDCVFRRITLRPCTSGLDKRLKSQIVGGILTKNKSIAKFTHRYFEIISWTILILSVASMVLVGISFYNFVKYGNCNGENSSAFCIYKDIEGAFKTDESCTSSSCKNTNCTCANASDCGKIHATCNETCYVSYSKDQNAPIYG